jgi:hypothetical protein
VPIDGQYHDLKIPLTGLTSMNVVEVYGIDLFSHANNLVMNVDGIQFRDVDFITKRLFSWEGGLEGWTTGPEAGHIHSIVSTGATHGTTALKLDRTSVVGNDPDPNSPNHSFVLGSSFTTTNAAVIADMVPAINRASSVAFDVTYQDGLDEGTGANPTFTLFHIQFEDHNGGIYQAQTANIDINGEPLTTTTLTIPIENFVDPTPGSTKTLVIDKLLETTNQFSIRLASNTDSGSNYYIDNFRLINEVISDTANFNTDLVVNGGDFELWKVGFGTNRAGDATGDNVTDGRDFLAWQRQTGGPATVSAVPEPAAWAIAMLAGVGLVGRRRG